MTAAAPPSLDEVPERSRIRLVLGFLFLLWAGYLAFTGKQSAALPIGLLATVITAGYFAGHGEAKVRRGSFLIAGALLFCAYFLAVFVAGGGTCGPSGCDDAGRNAGIALGLLAFASAGAGIGEVLQGLRPTERRARTTTRFSWMALAIFAALFYVSVG